MFCIPALLLTDERKISHLILTITHLILTWLKPPLWMCITLARCLSSFFRAVYNLILYVLSLLESVGVVQTEQGWWSTSYQFPRGISLLKLSDCGLCGS